MLAAVESSLSVYSRLADRGILMAGRSTYTGGSAVSVGEAKNPKSPSPPKFKYVIVMASAFLTKNKLSQTTRDKHFNPDANPRNLVMSDNPSTGAKTSMVQACGQMRAATDGAFHAEPTAVQSA
jgi:hypothetical protein